MRLREGQSSHTEQDVSIEWYLKYKEGGKAKYEEWEVREY
jgi:hypothetical protein